MGGDSSGRSKYLEMFQKIRDRDLEGIKLSALKIKNEMEHMTGSKRLLKAIHSTDRLSKSDMIYAKGVIEKVLNSRSKERAVHYLSVLEKALSKTKTNGINDINLNRWKEYDDILTDSLWLFPTRDRQGTHQGWYWGNFVPQIPRQLILRFSKKGDWIFDPFLGSGTTLIECRRLGRNGIGIEIDHNTVERARELIDREENNYSTITTSLEGDSLSVDFKSILDEYSLKKIDLAILHPPYHDIIKFSDRENDLSNSKTPEEFLERFDLILKKTRMILKKGGFIAIVIGDKYHKKNLIPLGFRTMNEALSQGLILKSVIVKNFEKTRGKREQTDLWRYRALQGSYYIFKHEYIFIFENR